MHAFTLISYHALIFTSRSCNLFSLNLADDGVNFSMSPKQTLERLTEDGLITIIRGAFSLEAQAKMAQALSEGGVTVLEVTLNTTDALKSISYLQKHFGDDLLVGAGTVRSAEDVDKAIDAGASFLIAPCLDLPSVERAQQHNVLLLPGIFTATEAQAAFVAGCQTVKLFPADVLGPKYLKGLRAPLEHIDFIPTGGVSPDTIGAFHDAGAVAFGVGSFLVNAQTSSDNLNDLSERAQQLRRALESARG